MGFIKLSYDKSKYHFPEGITNEKQQGASYKYQTEDGLEAIYETLYSGLVSVVSNDPYGTKKLILQQYPKIGPTFNYSPSSTFGEAIQDEGIAHYYFDMLPYYWWDNILR